MEPMGTGTNSAMSLHLSMRARGDERRWPKCSYGFVRNRGWKPLPHEESLMMKSGAAA